MLQLGMVVVIPFLPLGVEVGLEQEFYSVVEKDLFVEVCVVLSGELQRNPRVSIMTVDGTAQGMLDSNISTASHSLVHY